MKKLLYIPILGLLLSGCVNDLDVTPLDKNVVTEDQTFATEENYDKALSKIYSVLAISGQDGPGSSDIAGLDPGNAQLLRSWWNLQVVTTDECKNSWQDAWVPEINGMLWSNVKNESIEAVYQWSMYIVGLSNEFLKQASDEKISSRGFSDEFKQKALGMRAEARFMRAFAYYLLMDNYANPPFMTEENSLSSLPEQIERADLFDWIEGDLKAMRDDLKPAMTEYGRADQGVVDFLLARIYLNAEVYTGTAHWAEAKTAAESVINAGYDLTSEYKHLFMTDNDVTSKQEIIFPVVLDGNTTRTFGSMTFIIAASRTINDTDATANAEDGVTKAGWSGNRTTEALVKKFEFDGNVYEANKVLDKRGMFNDADRSLEINNPMLTFAKEGWGVRKFKHISSTGVAAQHEEFADTDFPLFRLADAYLIYAEAVVRTGDDKATAVGYINKLRARGFGDESRNIEADKLTLDFILDERAREMYWEGTRRQDLIRHDKYTTSAYLWPFKGGVKEGVPVNSRFNIFPIPVSDLSANPNLTQNTGY